MAKAMTIRQHERAIQNLKEEYELIEETKPYKNNDLILKSRLWFILDHKKKIKEILCKKKQRASRDD